MVAKVSKAQQKKTPKKVSKKAVRKETPQKVVSLVGNKTLA
jgi:hypothetical protein